MVEEPPKPGQTPAESETGDKYEAISKAQSFEELLAVIDQLGGIEGSKSAGGKFHSAEELKEKINKVREVSRIYLEGVTRTGGLRGKVIELLSKETEKSEE